LDGATPESIVDSYPSLSLKEAYSAIAYYLHHQSEVAEYMREREQRGDEVRKRIESHQRDISNLRARLLARKSGKL
jgi:hypothetical protein